MPQRARLCKTRGDPRGAGIRPDPELARGAGAGRLLP